MGREVIIGPTKTHVFHHARTSGRNLEVDGDCWINEELVVNAPFALKYGGALDLALRRILKRNK